MTPPVKSSLLRPSAAFNDDIANPAADDASADAPSERVPRILLTLSRYDEAPMGLPTGSTPPLRANFFGTSPSFGQRLPYPLDPASLRYDPSGRLASGTLAVDAKINGVSFTKGSQLYFHQNGSLRLGHLRKKQKVQGILCGPGDLWFYPNGKVSQTTLSSAQDIQGIHCDRGDVWFHDNGRLAQVSLAKDQNIQGTPCLRGTVWFHRNSVLSQATLAATQILRGLPLAGSTSLSFHKNGAFRSGTLSSDAQVRGLPCRNGTVVWFHDNRQLSQAILAADLTVQGKTFVTGDTVRFKEDGILE